MSFFKPEPPDANGVVHKCMFFTTLFSGKSKYTQGLDEALPFRVEAVERQPQVPLSKRTSPSKPQ